jgi:hypothetical protein
MTAREEDPPTIPAQIAGMTIQITCGCGDMTCHEIECEQDVCGGWFVAMEDRFILCEECDGLIDAGMQIRVGPLE